MSISYRVIQSQIPQRQGYAKTISKHFSKSVLKEKPQIILIKESALKQNWGRGTARGARGRGSIQQSAVGINKSTSECGFVQTSDKLCRNYGQLVTCERGYTYLLPNQTTHHSVSSLDTTLSLTYKRFVYSIKV